jgi:hypothetical protein
VEGFFDLVKKYDTKYIPFEEIKKLGKLNDWLWKKKKKQYHFLAVYFLLL